jgi:hypothetical protein
LLEAGASITVGDHHIANWLIGQVMDDAIDQQVMLNYADSISADRAEFESAMSEVVHMPREQFEKAGQALYLIAEQLSKMAIQNVQQARTIVEREQANNKLVRMNHLYRVVSTISQASAKARTPDELYQMACTVLVADGKFDEAWVVLLDSDQKTLIPGYHAGEPNREFNTLRIDVSRLWNWPAVGICDLQKTLVLHE